MVAQYYKIKTTWFLPPVLHSIGYSSPFTPKVHKPSLNNFQSNSSTIPSGMGLDLGVDWGLDLGVDLGLDLGVDG